MRHLKKILLLFSFLIIVCHNILLAQLSFTATISPAFIGKNETAELRLMVNNANLVEQIIAPLLNNFIIISGPNQESGMESNNGVTRNYIGYTYVLKPRTTGKFTINSAIAKADGKTIKSNRLTLEVNKHASGNSASSNYPGLGNLSTFKEQVTQSSFNDYIIKKGENIAEKVNKNIFIKLDVSKRSCYIGEPVVVAYKLYTRLKSESNIIKNPSFNGFSVIDLISATNNFTTIEKLNGREYNVYTLRKSQLYPLQPGAAELEPTEVENNLHFIKEDYILAHRNGLEDLFQDFAQTSIPPEGVYDEKVTLQSKTAFVNVLPLPEKDKPLTFKGAVGSFTIETAIEKNSFTTTEVGKLSITISGDGNMPMIIAPDINWPNGIEPAEPQAKETLNKQTVPVSGSKVFEYSFTTIKPGSYIIPSIAFSFFNVKEGKYKTITTKPITIAITTGNFKKPIYISVLAAKTDKEQFFSMLFTNRWLIIFPIAIVMVIGLFLWIQHEKKKIIRTSFIKNEETKKREALVKTFDQILQKPFVFTEEKLVDKDTHGFYTALNGELRSFLSQKLNIPLVTINKKRIAEEADKRGIAVNTSLQIQQLLVDIEWQLYAPFSDEDKMQDMYNDAASIAHALNTTTL